MNNTVYTQLYLYYLYGKSDYMYRHIVSSSGHYVWFVLSSVVIKSVYFCTLRRIWLKSLTKYVCTLFSSDLLFIYLDSFCVILNNGNSWHNGHSKRSINMAYVFSPCNECALLNCYVYWGVSLHHLGPVNCWWIQSMSISVDYTGYISYLQALNHNCCIFKHKTTLKRTIVNAGLVQRPATLVDTT
jgi:hypothetical protein